VLEELQDMEARLLAWIEGSDGGLEHCVACPEQRTKVSFFNTPNADDESPFDDLRQGTGVRR
jgi:hypothetical protein